MMISRYARAALATILISATALAHYGEGQLWIIDRTNSKVYFIDTEALEEEGISLPVVEVPLATSVANNPGGIGFSWHGHLLIANPSDNEVVELDGNGGTEVVLTGHDGLSGPDGSNVFAVGPGAGDLYIGNATSQEILVFDEDYVSGSVFADAADGIVNPASLAFTPDGELLVANRGAGNILKFDTSGNATTLITLTGEEPVAVLSRDNFDIYVLTEDANLYRYAGGDPNSGALLGTYGAAGVDSGMCFNHHKEHIWLINSADGLVRMIDPDTGDETTVATVPGSPSALMEVGGQYAPGTFYILGKPFPTTHPEPLLLGSGEPRIGQPATVTSHDWFGGSTVFLFVGFESAEIPKYGGTFYIGLDQGGWVFPMTAPGTPGVPVVGDIDIPFTMPNVPVLVGTKFYMQAMGTHAPAPYGVALTRALVMYVGI